VSFGCAQLKALTRSDEDVVYGADADENLAKGREAMESKNYPEAARYFEFVKTKYPFLEAAKTAELLLADTDYERDRLTEARDRYHNFVRLHPTHAQVDYAAYRAALTHYRDMPSDFFLLPPSTEKDQIDVKAATVAMADFIRNFKDSKYVPEAQKVLDEVRRRLAEHELYVAAFYARREKWPAVVGRLLGVAKNYANIGLEDRVYFGLYDAYLGLKDDARAKESLRTLIARSPQSPGAEKARKLLGAELEGPATAPALEVPPPAPRGT
jgi:outer membrane protein assembly factor BamD